MYPTTEWLLGILLSFTEQAFCVQVGQKLPDRQTLPDPVGRGVQHGPAVDVGNGDNDTHYHLPGALSHVTRFATSGEDADDSYPNDMFDKGEYQRPESLVLDESRLIYGGGRRIQHARDSTPYAHSHTLKHRRWLPPPGSPAPFPGGRGGVLEEMGT